MRDVEEAQQRIVAVIRKLEDDGEIVISAYAVRGDV
jgi:flagellar motor switch protein FliG